MRLPVNAGRSGSSRLLINFADERAAYSFAARAFVGEEVLQIAAPMPGKTLVIPRLACTFVRIRSRLFA
jgi:hypothetical protein